MADINLKAGNNIELRQDNNDLYIDQTPMNVELIAISDTAPTSCVENDKYYNTENNLVYTATDTDTWSEDGEEPIKDIFYILISNLKLYIYDGETLVEVSESEPIPSNVELLAVTNTAPSECSEGDKYFNTTTKKIYTATGENTWGSEGVDPILDIFYIVLSEQKIYTYNGDTLISVGGGAGGTQEIEISDTEPTDPDVKLWIDTGEVGSQASEITNEYSTSTGIGYSANYINNLCGNNLFTTENSTNGKYLYSNGTENTNNAWSYTDYIPVINDKQYYFYKKGISTSIGNNPSICFYNENKTFISGIAYSDRSNVSAIAPNNAKYVRISYTNTDSDKYRFILINNNEVYSNNEQIIGTWIDGKPLYRIVIDIGSLPNNTTKYVNHNISNVNIITNYSGVGKSSNNIHFKLPYTSVTATGSIQVYCTNTQIVIQTDVDRSAYNGYIIIEYTKTTD